MEFRVPGDEGFMCFFEAEGGSDLLIVVQRGMERYPKAMSATFDLEPLQTDDWSQMATLQFISDAEEFVSDNSDFLKKKLAEFRKSR